MFNCAGRDFLGKIDYDAFLMPFGLAVDKTGALLVVEASAPKIITVLDAALGRGVGTVKRVYLHNRETSQTSMVDDAPAEASLHPEGY